MTVQLDNLKLLLPQFDVSGPRYTSYPTANLFVEQPMDEPFQAVWDETDPTAPISIYVHVPFCDTVCFYCACNKIHTANRRQATYFVEALQREIALTAQRIGRRRVTQLHFGGGTPTYLDDTLLQDIFDGLRAHFDLSEAEDRDFSIEIDPRTVDEERISNLARLGFNRMSLGVQDFNHDVQVAINRLQADELIANAVKWGRENGFVSINFDLIYGLPHQSVEGFRNTLSKTIELSPDRISLYAYAHLPERFKVQRQIDVATLPTATLKISLFLLATEMLQAAGYCHLGMDHFVKPEDDLYQAQGAGRLTRNFMGYSTGGDLPLLGFGPSAIGQAGNCYWQNHKTLLDYFKAVDAEQLPFAKGYVLSDEDLIRRWVVQSLMCDLGVDTEAFEQEFSRRFYAHFAYAMPELQSFRVDRLVTTEHSRFRVTELGRFFLRNICMLFDQHLNIEHQFSKTV